MTNKMASLSLDADNLWAYQMTHGDPGWDDYATYLDQLVDRTLPMLAEKSLTITFFVVGKDAEIAQNREALRRLSQAGHEIGNHSFRHQPWLHRYTLEEIHTELRNAEDAILSATGERPIGFRGPGYSLSPDVIRALIDRQYEYDCSSLPTVIGPLARRYYFRAAKLTESQREQRAHLFGHASDGLRPLTPYRWDLGGERILEIPVTTMPLTRIPIHLSYVLYIAGVSRKAALQYFARSLDLCRLLSVSPSILLHPLDFLGADDVDSLRFFPGMDASGAHKRSVVSSCLDLLQERFDVITMAGHARALKDADLPIRPARTLTLEGHAVAR